MLTALLLRRLLLRRWVTRPYVLELSFPRRGLHADLVSRVAAGGPRALAAIVGARRCELRDHLARVRVRVRVGVGVPVGVGVWVRVRVRVRVKVRVRVRVKVRVRVRAAHRPARRRAARRRARQCRPLGRKDESADPVRGWFAVGAWERVGGWLQGARARGRLTQFYLTTNCVLLSST